MVTPTGSYPASTSSAAATEESTPPLMPTTMRCRLTRSVSRADQHGEPLEFVGVGVADLDASKALATDDAHARHERALQAFLERGQFRRAPALLRPRRASGGGCAHGVLGRTDRPIVRENLVAQLELLGRRGERQQRARVAHREPSAAQIVLDRLRQTEQTKRVGDRAPLLAHALGQLLLRPPEAREELVEGLGLLHRIQVLAQEVLDERELEALGVRDLTDNRGDAGESCLACRAPAALAGDELIARTLAPNDDRLDHP